MSFHLMGAALVLFACLSAFGAKYHWVEAAGTAERDAFVAEADSILNGQLPNDPFRPALYPLVVALSSFVTGDSFSGARVVSVTAAVGLALIAFGLGRRLGSVEAGWWTMALVVANPIWWIFGVQTTTDMSFAALAGAALLSALAYMERPSYLASASAGLAFGAAVFMRGNALLLMPALATAVAVAMRSQSQGANLRYLAVATFATAVFVLPHWLLRAMAFGDPFYDENWRNLAWKLHGGGDWSKLDSLSGEGSFARIVLAEPAAVIWGALQQLRWFARGGLVELLGSRLHVLLFAVACVRAVRRPHWSGLFLLGAAATFVTGVSAAFFAWSRFLLVIVPIASAVTVSEILRALGGREARAGGGRLLVTRTLVACVVVSLAVVSLGKVRVFVQSHPYAEVYALRSVEQSLEQEAALAGTSPFLARYLTRRYVALPDAFGDEITSPERYVSRLRQLLSEERVRYLAIGKADLRDRPTVLLGSEGLLPGLALIERRPDVALWKVVEAAQ